jgi:hypothetical protein
MAERLSETTGDITLYDLSQDFLAHHALRWIEMLNVTEKKTGVPPLSELLTLDHKKLDIERLPEGTHPVDGRYFHLEGYTFDHKDSKDPQRVIEELPDGRTRQHIYFSRGISQDVIIDRATGEPIKDPRYYDSETNQPVPQHIEVWGVGHLIADDESGRWAEAEPVVIHDVNDEPQMCAPSMYFTGGVFHMIIQGACFSDNHPVYHLTSTNGTDFYPQRKLLKPIFGTSESGVYDVDILNDDGKFFIVYSAMEPMGPHRKAVNEIHLAYIPSITGEEEAERMVELSDGLWVRVVKLGESKYGYFTTDDTENTSRIVRLNDGICMRLRSEKDGSSRPLIYSDGVWVLPDEAVNMDWVNEGFETSPQPGTPIVRYTDIPGHNPHPPVRQADETDSQRIERELLESNFEWGLEGMQILRLPNDLYALLGVCFLSNEPIGSRQRAFMAISDKITGPFLPLGLLVEPKEDNGWGDGENGHASAEIIGDKLHILYQARKPSLNDAPLAERLEARWQLGEAICDLPELCRLAETALEERAERT